MLCPSTPNCAPRVPGFVSLHGLEKQLLRKEGVERQEGWPGGGPQRLARAPSQLGAEGPLRDVLPHWGPGGCDVPVILKKEMMTGPDILMPLFEKTCTVFWDELSLTFRSSYESQLQKLNFFLCYSCKRFELFVSFSETTENR